MVVETSCNNNSNTSKDETTGNKPMIKPEDTTSATTTTTSCSDTTNDDKHPGTRSILKKTESEQQQSKDLPRTLMLPTMTSPSTNEQKHRVIRASPFEPLVHQRNFPGTISPVRFNEYTAPPPVQEIRIPTPQQHHDNDDNCIDNDDDSVSSEPDLEDYKTMYFCSMRENHLLKSNLSYVSEENRLLKRHLIEMQKQLFSMSRNKRRPSFTGSGGSNGIVNTAWTIPNSSPQHDQQHFKRRRVSINHQYHQQQVKIPSNHRGQQQEVLQSVSSDEPITSTNTTTTNGNQA